MIADQPSQTALTAAAARAAHLVVDDEPRIFAGPLAAVSLGERAAELLSYHRLHGTHVILASARAQVICRASYAERELARLAGLGVRQYVILGAGWTRSPGGRPRGERRGRLRGRTHLTVIARPRIAVHQNRLMLFLATESPDKRTREA